MTTCMAEMARIWASMNRTLVPARVQAWDELEIYGVKSMELFPYSKG
ncbi:MAG: hypothetical protein M0T73_00405 [Deltaproteobacteria bacterium]|nr:hypothetical protein [Deltaproteobacteria bacterium]